MDQLKDLKNQCDNYRQTVEALVTFTNTVTWDHVNNIPYQERKYSFGRRLKTTQQNSVSPDTVVTPDLAVERTARNGIVVEVKKTLPENKNTGNNETIWDVGVIKQLIKYDDNLAGWFTEDLIESIDIVLLTDLTLCVKVKEFVIDRNISFQRKFAIVGFERSSNNEEFITFKGEYGGLTDTQFWQKLQHYNKVPLEKAFRSLGCDYKFYDSEPPVPLLTDVLWTYVLFKHVGTAQKDLQLNCKVIDISLDNATYALQEYYGSTGNKPNQQEFPHKDWVRNSFKFLKKIGLAKIKDEAQEIYTFLLRHIAKGKDRGEYFCQKWLETESKKAKKKKPAQQTLFS